MSDAINPDHYKRLPVEAIDIIEAAINSAPTNQDAYLHGQVLKYVLRCWNKNGIEDLKKAKWYLDRLVNSLDEYETQKAADLQLLKDHPFGKLRQSKWIPKVGDWVRIRKPVYTESDEWRWHEEMDEYNGSVVEVKQFDGATVVHEGFGFPFDWLEPSEQPAIKQSLTTEPPDGWRFLEVGEVIRKADRGFENKAFYAIEPIKIGMTLQAHWMPIIRRNRFEVGEKVIDCRAGVVFTVQHFNKTHQIVFVDGVSDGIESKHFAPYIEETT